MSRVTDVEQQSITTASPTRPAYCRIESDVVALAGSGARPRVRRWSGTEHFGDEPWQVRPELGAVGRGWSAGAPARLDVGSQLLVGEKAGQHLLFPKNRDDESAVRLRCCDFVFLFLDIQRRFTVLRRCGESGEDPRRRYDRRLLRMRQWHLDHFNAEESRVRVLVR